MNQNTTVETIREAIGKITKSLTHCRDLETSLPLLREARSALCLLINHLKAEMNTPPEQLRMIANRLLIPGTNAYSVRVDLLALANRLEAAPQPPVEQSEPTHPFTMGEYDGRELRIAATHDDMEQLREAKWRFIDELSCWLAPPAVIEPEPELDEFEAWVTDVMGDNSLTDGVIDTYGQVLDKYREIISRKGDK